MSKVVATLQVRSVEHDQKDMNVCYEGTFTIRGEFQNDDEAESLLTLDHTFNINLFFKADTGTLMQLKLYKLNAPTEATAWTSIIGDVEEWKREGIKGKYDMNLASKRDKGYTTVEWAVLTLVHKLYHAVVAPPSNKIRDGRFQFTHSACDEWLVKAMYEEFNE